MTNCRTRCCCNIATVVVMIYKHTSKNPTAVLRLRSLFLICAQFNTGLSAEHIADVRKYAADALSTDNVSFLQRVLSPPECPKWLSNGSGLATTWERSSTVDAEIPPVRVQALHGFLQGDEHWTTASFRKQSVCFCGFTSQEGLSRTTIRLYLSAIRHHHIGSGRDDPGITNISHLEYILRELREKKLIPQYEGETANHPCT